MKEEKRRVYEHEKFSAPQYTGMLPGEVRGGGKEKGEAADEDARGRGGRKEEDGRIKEES